MGESALVEDHSTVPLTQISCNTVFSKSQNARKAGTLCSNVLPLHFSPRQASSNQNSKFDSHLLYCEVDSLKHSKSESPLTPVCVGPKEVCNRAVVLVESAN